MHRDTVTHVTVSISHIVVTDPIHVDSKRVSDFDPQQTQLEVVQVAIDEDQHRHQEPGHSKLKREHAGERVDSHQPNGEACDFQSAEEFLLTHNFHLNFILKIVSQPFGDC